MNNGASIIDKIKSDAEIEINESISAAKEKADKIIARADKIAADELNKLKGELPVLENEIISRRLTVANIDAKKILLIKKTEIIDSVFSDAEEYIAKDKRYKPRLLALIKECAEDGDAVIIGSEDTAAITEKDIDELAKAKKIKLSVSREKPEFRHGVVLVGKSSDKNLTLDGLIRQERDNLITAVTDKLFGGKIPTEAPQE